GWSCSLATLSCSRTDVLASGASYPAIMVGVSVASNAPASVVNTATVSGGGDNTPANNTASDPTSITAGAVVPGTVNLITTAVLTKQPNGSYLATVIITNLGTGTAQGVVLSSAILGAASGTPVPQAMGNIPPSGYSITTFSFPSSAGTSGAAAAEKYSGTYTGGSFTGSIRAVLP
ncbi:MAG TPA: hypothetical protein VMT89_09685, partial [Candidatus Acidoferrales bacterium]|nr:hypothetical protein [Candidatus Acidoferrales bacterium]